MSTPRQDQIREFVLDALRGGEKKLGPLLVERFGFSRQNANKHLQRLVNEGVIGKRGATRAQVHYLREISYKWDYDLNAEDLEEDRVYREDLAPVLEGLPKNVIDLWHYGFTEMMNNAMDHSAGSVLQVRLEKTDSGVELWIIDNGVGIFQKIMAAKGLDDERHAALELTKGKLTSDPSQHSGQGVFFTSRSFDDFYATSGRQTLIHRREGINDEDWILDRSEPVEGTAICLELASDSKRTLRSVFDAFSTPGSFEFNRTVVPVSLAQYSNEGLISRSQAKRLMARLDSFQHVILDFSGIEMIGQSFADQIFRVFQSQHPEIEITALRANEDVRKMIQRASTG